MCYSQYIYIENFNTDDNKGWIHTSSDFTNVDWTMDVTGGSLTASSDWFSVKNDMLEARDVDGEVYWYSPELEISAYSDVSIQIDLSESGNHESADHIYCWYSLDGAAYILFDSQSDDFNSATASVAGLNGSTIRICIQMKNNAGGEYLRADNVTVSGLANPSACHAMGTQTTGSLIEWTIDDSGGDGTFSTLWGEDAYLLICHNGITTTNYGTGSSLSGNIVLNPGDVYAVTWVDNSTNYAYEHSYSVSMDGIVIASAAEADASGSGFTYIMYDDGTVSSFTWTGNGDPTNWNDADNWATGIAPSSSDDCIIPATPAGPFPDLAIPGTYDCADLSIESGGSSTMLQIRSGVELDVSGNFSDVYGLVNVEGKLDVVGSATFSKGVTVLGTGEIEVDGASTIGSGFTLTIGDGTFDANGSFDASGATIDMNDGNLTIASTVSLGDLDELQGTVTYDGGTSFVSDTYYNLVISSGNEHTASSTVTVNGDLTISSGTYRPLSHTTTVSGNTDVDGTLYITTGTFNADGNFDATGGTIDFTSTGELKLSSSVTSLGTLDQTKGTVWYDGGAINVITDTYYNLKVSQSGTKTAVGNISVNGDFDAILASTFDTDSYTTSVTGATSISSNLHIGSGTFNADGSFDASGGNIVFNGSGSLALSSDVTDLGALTDFTGTIIYDGTSAQTVMAPSSGAYNNLIIENASTKTAGENIDVDGDLTTEAESGCVFDLSSFNLNLAGNLTVGEVGGLDASDAGCTVTFDGNTTVTHAGSSNISSVSNDQVIGDYYSEGYSYGQSPFRGWYEDGRNQYIVLASELSAAGFSSGTVISGLETWVTTKGSTAPYNLEVKMGHTSTSAISTYDWLVPTEQTTVFSGLYSTVAGSYQGPTWTSTFTWNGTDNILVEYCHDENDYTDDDYVKYDNYTNGAYINVYGYDDGVSGCSMVADYASFYRPLFKFIASDITNATINPTFNEVVVNGGDVTLSSPIDVTSALTLTSGYIISETDVNGNNSQAYASTNTLTIKDGANHSGASDLSHVLGAVRIETSSDQLTVEFPTGDGTNYRPVFLTTDATTATTYTAEYVNSAHSSISYDGNGYNNTPCEAGEVDHVAMGCWWDIEKSAGGADAFVGINWDANSGVDTPSDIVLTHWNSTTSQWDKISGAGDVTTQSNGGGGAGSGTASSGRITSATAQSDFSPFNLGSGSGNNSLPVDLLSFHTVCSHDIVDVNFSVVSQINNDYFLIERSTDAMDWEVVGQIDGVEGGNSNTQMDYVFVDNNPLANLSYYRLTQVDFDGKSKTFYPVSTTCGGSEGGLPIDVYPNPASNEVTVELELDNYQGNDVYYTITDATGKAVLSDYVQLDRGFNKHTLDIGKLPNGVYILRFNQTKDHITETRIVKR